MKNSTSEKDLAKKSKILIAVFGIALVDGNLNIISCHSKNINHKVEMILYRI
jgi:hypothetical protein